MVRVKVYIKSTPDGTKYSWSLSEGTYESITMQVALHGSYYGYNFGDILLLTLYNNWIRSAAPRSRVVLPRALPVIRNQVGADNIHGWRSLISSDALVFGGGGYFGEPPENSSSWTRRFIARHGSTGLAFSALRKPIAIIGVGAGPLSHASARTIALKLLERSVVIAVRDAESKSYLESYGVESSRINVTADAALALSEEDIPDVAKRQIDRLLQQKGVSRWIGVHLSSSSDHGGATAVIREAIAKYSHRYPEIGVVIFSDSPGIDQAVNIRLLAEMIRTPSVLLPYSDPWTVAALLSRLDLVVTTKLHVGIVATALGKPVISFPRHWKTPRFYRQMSASHRCIPLAEVCANGVAGLFEKYWTQNLQVDIPIELREAANRNRTLLQHFLESV